MDAWRYQADCVKITSGEAKAGYRRANDKGQWWEAGASDKEGSEQNGKGRMPEKIQKRQANAGSH